MLVIYFHNLLVIYFQILLPFSRDTTVLKHFSHSSATPAKSYIRGKMGVEDFAINYPPNGVIPFHGFAMYGRCLSTDLAFTCMVSCPSTDSPCIVDVFQLFWSLLSPFSEQLWDDMHFVWFSMWDEFFSPRVSESRPSRLRRGWLTWKTIQHAFSHILYTSSHFNQAKYTEKLQSWKACEMDLSHNCSLHGRRSEVCEKKSISHVWSDTLPRIFHLR